jgi:hypothetical protein
VNRSQSLPVTAILSALVAWPASAADTPAPQVSIGQFVEGLRDADKAAGKAAADLQSAAGSLRDSEHWEVSYLTMTELVVRAHLNTIWTVGIISKQADCKADQTLVKPLFLESVRAAHQATTLMLGSIDGALSDFSDAAVVSRARTLREATQQEQDLLAKILAATNSAPAPSAR